MTTAFVTHEAGFTHYVPPGHPEQSARLDAVHRAVERVNLEPVKAPLASHDDVLRCHDSDYVSTLDSITDEQGVVSLDGEDTLFSVHTREAAYRGVGGAIRAVDLVMSSEVTNAFVAMRPPGHHAEHDKAMGFCIFGSVAIAAKYALDHHGLSRVAIVDFDVHHGNGTQDLVENDPRILFISSHQTPLYPWSGRAHDYAPDHVINVELKDGDGSAEFQAAYLEQVFPQIDAFKPELMIISAGFDAHRQDPLAGLMLETNDYSWVTKQLCDLAKKHAKRRVVSYLEGGYDLEALEASVFAHVKVLEEEGR